MDRLFADIDAGREFRGGIVGEVLAYVAGEGFGPTMKRLNVARGENSMWDNAQRFRQRYVVNAIEDMLKTMAAGRF